MIKLFRKAKDGGPESNVTGYWLIEWKRVFSVALLKFDVGFRENYHNHAFNAISIILCGGTLLENVKRETGDKYFYRVLSPSILPVVHKRECMHRVECITRPVWVLTIRGPWSDTWKEYSPKHDKFIKLTHQRKVIDDSINR